VRPYEGAFGCRKSKRKDECNGLIGHAWTIEPLIMIGSKLHHREYMDLSQEILIKHDYDTEIHLWRNLGVKGQLNSINKTFNQQLWFSALSYIVGKRCKNNILLDRAKDFFNHLNLYMKFSEKGLIQHKISVENSRKRGIITRYFLRRLRNLKKHSVFHFNETIKSCPRSCHRVFTF